MTTAPERHHHNKESWVGAEAAARGEDCGHVAALALALLADSRAWIASHFPHSCLPVEALSLAGASVSPWRTVEELAPCVRMYLWIFAIDTYIEAVTPQDGGQLDEMLGRTVDIVAGRGRDDSHWLLSSLSELQSDLSAGPLYPALSELWLEKFESMLACFRWEWASGGDGDVPSGVQDYLAHVDTIATWVCVLPRWIVYGDRAVAEHLETLVEALGEYVVASRLANDLAGFSRERDIATEGNILRYGVPRSWVVAKIDRHVDTALRLLAPLVADGVMVAVELAREIEFAMAFYSVSEFRQWDGDAD